MYMIEVTGEMHAVKIVLLAMCKIVNDGKTSNIFGILDLQKFFHNYATSFYHAAKRKFRSNLSESFQPDLVLSNNIVERWSHNKYAS